MGQWSIPSNVINYVHYSKNSKNVHTIPVRSMNKNKVKYRKKTSRER